MASDGRQLPHGPQAISVPLLALAAALLALAAFTTTAGAEVVYDNPPAAAEPEALGFGETGTAELGALVRLASTARLDPRVSVVVEVDACGEGSTASGCTTPAATFPLPATLSVYAGSADGSPAAPRPSRSPTRGRSRSPSSCRA